MDPTVELWEGIDNGQVLFEGPVLKRSEILYRWNSRYVRIVRVRRDLIVCLYWASTDDATQNPKQPRGMLDGSKATLDNDPSNLEIEIRHVVDIVRESDCFGSRQDIAVNLRTSTFDEFESLCGALGGAVAEEASNSVSSALSYERERKPGRLNSGSSITSPNANGDSQSKKTNRLERDYELLGELGRGAFSVVYRARSKVDGDREVAVKVVMLNKLNSRERKTQFRYLNSEVAIMRKIKERLPGNRHVVHLLESFAETRPSYRVALALELCNGGELFDRIVKRSHFSEKDAKDVIRALAVTLKELHGIGIVHRDLKPENLIYETKAEDANIKITDFGLAMDNEYPENDVYKSHVVGTCGYFAPEVMQLRYSPACDIWSLGVILYILLVGYPPFVGKTRMQVQKEIRLGRYEFHMPEWKDISLSARDLISKMLQVRPRSRISTSGILTHPWLTSSKDADNVPLSLNKHKQFNTKRKLKAAAYAVMWGTKFRNKRKDKLNVLAKKLKPEGFKSQDLDMIKEAFHRHAESSDGSSKLVTDLEQLRKIMSDLGYKELPLERMFKLFDENNDGFIEQSELLSGLASLQGPGEDSIRFCFSVYDRDGSGDIDKDELVQILSMCITNTSLDPEKVSTELSEAFDAIDTDRNGAISFEEFKTACDSKPYLVDCLMSRKLSTVSSVN